MLSAEVCLPLLQSSFSPSSLPALSSRLAVAKNEGCSPPNTLCWTPLAKLEAPQQPRHVMANRYTSFFLPVPLPPLLLWPSRLLAHQARPSAWQDSHRTPNPDLQQAGSTGLCRASRRSTAQEGPPPLPAARPEQQDQSIACGGEGSAEEELRRELVGYHCLTPRSLRLAWREKRIIAWDFSRHSLHSSCVRFLENWLHLCSRATSLQDTVTHTEALRNT